MFDDLTRCAWRWHVPIVALLIAIFSASTTAAKPAASSRCYSSDAPVACFVDAAKTRLAHVAKPDDRAEAIGEMLYALAAVGVRDEAVMNEGTTLAANRSLRPVKQMDLLYMLDVYAAAAGADAERTHAAALRRFATLERELKGDALTELYANACSIVAWDAKLSQRWLGFAHVVCTPERLRGANPQGVPYKALVLAMMPVAMTFAEDRDGFSDSADHALSWLRAAERAVVRSKNRDEKAWVTSVGVLMHMMNSLCLDIFDEADAADDEIEASLRSLRRLEVLVGISGRSTAMRRMVVDALFDTGRKDEAKKMLRQMLSRIDADAEGRNIPFSEQVAILLQAAQLQHSEQSEPFGTCVPEDAIET